MRILRPVSLTDRAAVEQICRRSFEGYVDYIPVVFERWVGDAVSPFYGLFEDGVLLGIGRVRPLDEGLTGWCEGLRVAPFRRGQRVGHELLAHAIEVAGELGARRLRAATYSENPASARLFAAAGCTELARFDRWIGQPAGGGRLPRPLPVGELDQALAFVARSAPYEAAGGAYAVDWTAYDLDAERMALHLERQEVLLAGDGIGALAIVTDFAHEGGEQPKISFLCGAPVAVVRLLRGIRTLALLRGLGEIQVSVAAGSGLEGMLEQGGFAPRIGGQIVLQQRTLGRPSGVGS